MNGPSLMVADIPFSPIVLMNFTKSYDPSKLNYNNKHKSKLAQQMLTADRKTVGQDIDHKTGLLPCLAPARECSKRHKFGSHSNLHA
jgi:hypothetical protein